MTSPSKSPAPAATGAPSVSRQPRPASGTNPARPASRTHPRKATRADTGQWRAWALGAVAALSLAAGGIGAFEWLRGRQAAPADAGWLPAGTPSGSAGSGQVVPWGAITPGAQATPPVGIAGQQGGQLQVQQLPAFAEQIREMKARADEGLKQAMAESVRQAEQGAAAVEAASIAAAAALGVPQDTVIGSVQAISPQRYDCVFTAVGRANLALKASGASPSEACRAAASSRPVPAPGVPAQPLPERPVPAEGPAVGR